VANGHIDDTVRNIRGNVGYAQPPQLFLNNGKGIFRDVAAEAGAQFVQSKVGRGVAFGDFDRDGDVDLLITTNNGPAYLYRNDQSSGNRSVRFGWWARSRIAMRSGRRCGLSAVGRRSRGW